MKILISIFCGTIFLTQSSFASGLYFAVAARGGLGQGATADGTSTEKRDLVVYGADATLGVMLGNVMVGGSAEYDIWKQKTEASEVNGTNISGNQLTFSPVVSIAFGNFGISAKLPIISTFSLDRETLLGNKAIYKSPNMPAYGVSITYDLGKYFVGIEHTQMEYKKINLNGQDSELSSDTRLSLSSNAVVYGYKF